MARTNFFGNIAKKWKVIQGSDNWKNLLDPLDIDLRQSIINYGELSQATYDGFNREKRSPNAGAPRYNKSNFFERVDMFDPNSYKITKFVYATSSIEVPEALMVKSLSREAWSKESNFIGYVAVATDEGKALLGRRDIVVAWRGTMQQLEWATNFNSNLVSASPLLGPTKKIDQPRIHEGWLSMYTSSDEKSRFNKLSARDQVSAEIRRLMDEYKDEEMSITITGHSLGAALATINAIDIAANHLNSSKNSPSASCLVTGIVFGSPRVGDSNFKKVFNEMTNLRLLSVHNVPDIVPKSPPSILYHRVGVELTIDTRKLPYLRSTTDVHVWHNLENYMHGIAGVIEGGFKLVIDRDLALVNKLEDSLKEEHHVPVAWWIPKNRAMVKGDDGRWKLDDHEVDPE